MHFHVQFLIEYRLTFTTRLINFPPRLVEITVQFAALVVRQALRPLLTFRLTLILLPLRSAFRTFRPALRLNRRQFAP
jgi:hypothetical protein